MVDYTNKKLLDEAKRVIEEEANALSLLAKNIPTSFEDAIESIYESNGSLVVVGIGKSGHIGRKISSTMASTGQKSYFMHPSEAQHGDLGMIDHRDILLLISYSGETLELSPIIEHAKRLGIKTISITGNAKSMLAQNTDIVLNLPIVHEACPLGCAPTVSSTLTLALGDALAISLLSKRGFTKSQFKTLHPGGALGKSLTFVYDIMHTEERLPIVSSQALMSETIVVMTKHGLGCVGVVDAASSRIIGIITDGDLRRNMDNSILSKNVCDVMTKNPVCINKNILLAELLRVMEDKKITCIFIVDENKTPIGCVHLHDIIQKKII